MDINLEIPKAVFISALNKYIEALINRYDELGMRASGDWADSLEATVDGLNGKILGLPYTEQLVNGRPPGRFPPPSNIQEWVQQKLGITDDREIKSVAYLVGRKIAESGTNIFERGGSNLLEVLDDDQLFNIYVGEISEYYRIHLNNIFSREIKTLKK